MRYFELIKLGEILEGGFECGVQFEALFTWKKRWFGRGFYEAVFRNMTSGWYLTTKKRFKTLIEASAWVKDVLQRIERGEL